MQSLAQHFGMSGSSSSQSSQSVTSAENLSKPSDRVGSIPNKEGQIKKPRSRGLVLLTGSPIGPQTTGGF